MPGVKYVLSFPADTGERVTRVRAAQPLKSSSLLKTAKTTLSPIKTPARNLFLVLPEVLGPACSEPWLFRPGGGDGLNGQTLPSTGRRDAGPRGPGASGPPTAQPLCCQWNLEDGKL